MNNDKVYRSGLVALGAGLLVLVLVLAHLIGGGA